jgi:hypothetical protein
LSAVFPNPHFVCPPKICAALKRILSCKVLQVIQVILCPHQK